MSQGIVYLIHFEKPIGNLSNPRGQAQHYLGYSNNVPERLIEHARGQGSAIMAFLFQSGIGWLVTRTWKGTRRLERKLKNRKSAKTLCPVCQHKGETHGELYRAAEVSNSRR